MARDFTTEEIFIETPEAEEYICASYSRPSGFMSEKVKASIGFMIHGFPGNKAGTEGFFEDIEKTYLDLGICTLRFDFKGSGKSDGKSENFTFQNASKDLKTVFAWVENQGFTHLHVVSEGLGTAIAALSGAKTIKSHVMAWPAADMQNVLEHYFYIQDKEGMETLSVFEYEGHKVGKSLIEEIMTLDILPHLQAMTAPALILHGTKDDKIPILHLDVLRKDLGSERLDITSFQDGTNGLPDPNHRKAIRFHVRHFLEKYALK